MTDLIIDDLVTLDAVLGDDSDSVIHGLAALLEAAGRSTSADALAADAMAREMGSPTGLPGGIAIPHCRTDAVTAPVLAFARLARRVSFGAKDGRPADLVFLIAAPTQGASDHLTILSLLATALARPSFVTTLRQAEETGEALTAIQAAVRSFEPSAPPAPPAATEAAIEASTDEAASSD